MIDLWLIYVNNIYITFMSKNDTGIKSIQSSTHSFYLEVQYKCRSLLWKVIPE